MVDLTGFKLTFDDEFNTRSISQTGASTTWSDIRPQWRYDSNSDIGFGTSSFVDPASGYDPFSVAGGALAITAVPDRTAYGYPGSEESGLISTEGKFSQTYGYFEMRAQTSGAPGSWDAFWMLPDKPTANQELDVMEHYGNNDPGTYSTIHTSDNTPASALQVYSQDNARSTGYHTYGMDWEPDKISFYVDGKLMGSQATPSDMHSPMYLLADLATQSGASSSAMTMKIDYIRGFSKDPSATAVTQDAVSAPDGRDPGLYGAAVSVPAAVTPPSTTAVNVTSTTTPLPTPEPAPAPTTTTTTTTLTANPTDTPVPSTPAPATTALTVPSQPIATSDPVTVDPSGTITTAWTGDAQTPNAAAPTTTEDLAVLANIAWGMPAISQHGMIAAATTRLMSVLQHDSAALGASASFDDIASDALSYLTDHPGYGLASTLLQGVMSGHDGGAVSDLVSNLAADQNPHVFTATAGYHLGHTISQNGF